MTTHTLTPQQRIERCHVWLMKHKDTAAMSGIIMTGTWSLTDKVPTAGTDGLNVMYNPAFVDTLTEPELRFLIGHEAAHKYYRQIAVWRALPNKQLLNMAMDYVINLELVDMSNDWAMPAQGLMDRRFAGMDTGEVYKILESENAGGGGGNSLDEHDFDGAESLDDAEVAKEIDNAIRQGKILAGKIGAKVPRSFDILTEPKIDWRDVLHDWVSDTCAGDTDSTWRKPNRRWMHTGIYLPTTYTERVGRLVVAVDTSGSIDNSTLSKFYAELLGILRTTVPETVDLIYWDAAVAKHEIYTPDTYESLVSSTKPAGGGGTDVRCVVEYINTNKLDPVGVIVFTDGDLYAGWGDWSHPVLWCIVSNKSAQPPVGVTCHI